MCEGVSQLITNQFVCTRARNVSEVQAVEGKTHKSG